TLRFHNRVRAGGSVARGILCVRVCYVAILNSKSRPAHDGSGSGRCCVSECFVIGGKNGENHAHSETAYFDGLGAPRWSFRIGSRMVLLPPGYGDTTGRRRRCGDTTGRRGQVGAREVAARDEAPPGGLAKGDEAGRSLGSEAERNGKRQGAAPP